MFFSSLLVSLVLSVQTAVAVEWPDISEPIDQAGAESDDSVLIISLEDYELLSPVRNASSVAEAWRNYFERTQGVPASQITWLSDAQATRGQITSHLKRAAKKVNRQGRLWVVYIGHGITMYDDGAAAILPYEASDEPKELYEQAIDMTNIAELLGKSDSKTIVLLDASFTGLDRQGHLLLDTLPEQPGQIPLITRRTTVISATNLQSMHSSLKTTILGWLMYFWVPFVVGLMLTKMVK